MSETKTNNQLLTDKHRPHAHEKIFLFRTWPTAISERPKKKKTNERMLCAVTTQTEKIVPNVCFFFPTDKRSTACTREDFSLSHLTDCRKFTTEKKTNVVLLCAITTQTEKEVFFSSNNQSHCVQPHARAQRTSSGTQTTHNRERIWFSNVFYGYASFSIILLHSTWPTPHTLLNDRASGKKNK